MANTSSRSLRLLSLLQNHRFWPGQELADQLEVTPRTLRRDIERLRGLGYPVESHPGVDGGYQLSGGATMPPLLLDGDEAVALAVGLHAAAFAGVDGLADSALRALTKVLRMMGTGPRSQVDALLATTVFTGPGERRTGHDTGTGADAEALTVLSQACRDSVRVTFSYSDRKHIGTSRTVEPYRLVTQARRWYLVAFDPDRQDWRTFRVDRIGRVEVLRNSFEPRALPSDDIGDYVRRRIERSNWADRVTVRVAASEEVVRHRIGRFGTVVALDNQSCELQMATESFGWVVHVLESLRADFTVVEPPGLLAYVRECAAFLTRNADGSS